MVQEQSRPVRWRISVNRATNGAQELLQLHTQCLNSDAKCNARLH